MPSSIVLQSTLKAMVEVSSHFFITVITYRAYNVTLIELSRTDTRIAIIPPFAYVRIFLCTVERSQR
jgi:hypothetical protein